MKGTKIWDKKIDYIGMLGDTLIASNSSEINALNVDSCKKIWSCN